jgi:hypothetical protein
MDFTRADVIRLLVVEGLTRAESEEEKSAKTTKKRS